MSRKAGGHSQQCMEELNTGIVFTDLRCVIKQMGKGCFLYIHSKPEYSKPKETVSFLCALCHPHYKHTHEHLTPLECMQKHLVHIFQEDMKTGAHQLSLWEL